MATRVSTSIGRLILVDAIVYMIGSTWIEVKKVRRVALNVHVTSEVYNDVYVIRHF